MDRRGFLRLAAGAATPGACRSGSGSGPSGQAATATREARPRTLRIALWSHFIPPYDRWFDEEYTQRWGEEHGVDVVVDHIPYAQLGARAGGEVAAGRGHDLFAFITPPPGFEDDVIDHREIVEEVEAKVGKMAPVVERNVLNPKTGRYFGFSDFWVPNPVHYRTDLWDDVEPGLVPSSWGDVRRAAPPPEGSGHAGWHRLLARRRLVFLALQPPSSSEAVPRTSRESDSFCRRRSRPTRRCRCHDTRRCVRSC